MYGVSGSMFRLSGLATGLDTDQMVKDLMRAERMPLDKLEQKKQLAEWRRDDYREITNLLRGFKEEFFDILNSDSYILTERAFKVFNVTSSNSEYVTAEGLTTAQPGSHTVKVLQVATADTAVSIQGISKPLTGIPTDYNLAGKKIDITVDGVTRQITLDNYAGLDDLITKPDTGLQALIDKAFGAGKISVSNNGGELLIEPAVGSGVSNITMSGSYDGSLELLGFTSGDSNRIFDGHTLEELASQLNTTLNFDANGDISFSINGETFRFSKDTTLEEVMDTINKNTNAKVKMTYDEVSDKISITSTQLGAGDNIQLQSIGGNFFEAIGIDVANPVTIEGQDAKAEIDGQIVTRSENTFTVNNVRYTLHKEHDAENPDDTITLEQDVDAVYDKIKAFVDKYNEVIDKINTELREEYDREYPPLTDEQKDALSEDEIEKWEKKAKTGLLRNDPILQKIVSDMRMALIDSVDDVNLNLPAIGISSSSYKDRGKLYIDETKLKNAIRENPDEVMNLFIQRSESVPSYERDLTSGQRSARFKEEGLLWRVSDIVEDNISTIRDSSGKKGVLLEKAGMIGDVSEFKNSLYYEIEDYKDEIDELYVKLFEKEQYYYNKFTQMEKMVAQMNSQASWLMSQMGMGGA